MRDELTVTRVGENVFADLGLPNAEEHLLKAQIVAMIGRTIRRYNLTQTAAAERMGIAQPDVSRLLRGRFDGFSLERLLGFLMLLGHDIRIDIIEPANENREPKRVGHLCLAHA